MVLKREVENVTVLRVDNGMRIIVRVGTLCNGTNLDKKGWFPSQKRLSCLLRGRCIDNFNVIN